MPVKNNNAVLINMCNAHGAAAGIDTPALFYQIGLILRVNRSQNER